MRTQRWTAGLMLSAGLIASAISGADSSSAQGVGSGHGRDLLAQPQRAGAALGVLNAADDAEAAKRNGLTLAALRRHAEDPNAWLDRSGALYYVEPPVPVAAASAEPAVAAAPFAYDQTFLLHSRPGATRKLFLDFDGHTLTGTGWNASYGSTIIAEPYDTDSLPATFSTAEMDVVQDVWRRIAEDYSTLDVDVTTEDPGVAGINRSGSTDVNFGSRLVISPMTTIYSSCSCGGIAYVGVIDSTGTTHDYYQPAFVFTRGVGNGAKNIAEAGSHEFGHNLGLGHDGTASLGYYTGHGPWAPIMGVGYNRPVSQWSRGEYSGANNVEDDFAVMAANQIPTRVDDFGSLAAPTPVTGSNLAIAGIIGTRTDVDAFNVAAGDGPATFTVAPAALGANLDARLELRDSSGAVIAASDPAVTMTNASTATGLGATVTATLTAGNYTVVVDGVGFGDALTTGYSDYGSVGQYTLSGSFVSGPPANVPPTAVASASPASGTAPLAVTYSSTGSADSDGSIASYLWTFADGTTSNVPNPSKTYSTAGTFLATLTVTDDRGATALASVTVVANPLVVTNALRVETMTMTVRTSRNKTTASVVVKVTNTDGVAQSGVAVSGAFSGVVTGTKSGSTNTSGLVTLTSQSTSARSGTFTFTVSNLTKSGSTYTATNNLIGSVSKTF